MLLLPFCLQEACWSSWGRRKKLEKSTQCSRGTCSVSFDRSWPSDLPVRMICICDLFRMYPFPREVPCSRFYPGVLCFILLYFLWMRLNTDLSNTAEERKSGDILIVLLRFCRMCIDIWKEKSPKTSTERIFRRVCLFVPIPSTSTCTHIPPPTFSS